MTDSRPHLHLDPKQALPHLNPSSSADETAPVFTIGATDSPVFRAWHPLLSIMYVVDENLVREADLGNLTDDELHTIAMGNLRVRASRLRLKNESGAAHVVLDNAFEASTLLLDELWDDRFLQGIKQEIVVAVPARNVVAFSCSSSPEGISELRRLVAYHHPGGDHLMVKQLLVRRARGWDLFD